MSDQRVAVVTGAAGTIGGSAAAHLGRAGALVVAVDKEAERLTEFAAGLAPVTDVLPVAADLSRPDAAAVIQQAVADRGWASPTILVNNAGITIKHNGLKHGLTQMDMEEWDLTLAVNLTAPMLLAKTFLPGMVDAGWGRIVNVSSRAGRYNPYQAGPAYSASKAALLGLTRSIATDFGPFGITCNAVAPGYIASGMSATLSADGLAKLVERTPLGRAGTGDEAGATIAFLASEEGGYITGTCVDVNGGQSMA